MPTRIAGLVALLAVLASPVALAQNNVDTVVTNGKILTVDAAFRVVQAVAINDGRIVASGTREEVARYAGARTQVIDVGGKTVIPGLIDNHFHLTRAVDSWAASTCCDPHSSLATRRASSSCRSSRTDVRALPWFPSPCRTRMRTPSSPTFTACRPKAVSREDLPLGHRSS